MLGSPAQKGGDKETFDTTPMADIYPTERTVSVHQNTTQSPANQLNISLEIYTILDNLTFSNQVIGLQPRAFFNMAAVYGA